MSNELATTTQGLDLHHLFKLARELVPSGMLPDHINNDGKFVATVMAGHELGLPPMASLRSIHLVKGKVVIGADAQLALLHQAGIRSEWLEMTTEVARLALSRGADQPQVFAYTIAEAKTAGLVRKDRKGNDGMWHKYPAAMLRARCISAAARAFAPEVLMGCYTPDEAAEFVESVELPPPTPLAVIEPKPVDWREEWDEVAGHDFDGTIMPFLASLGLDHPKDMDPEYRSRVLAKLNADPKPLDVFVNGTGDDLNKHFCTRFNGLHGPGTLKAYDGEKDDWKFDKEVCEQKRHHVQRRWWGVDSLNDVTPQQALHGAHSIAWMRAMEPDDFAAAVADALADFEVTP